MHQTLTTLDPKEVDLPDTLFAWDIETRVFQTIVVRCLSQIEGVEPVEGGLLDSLLGRDVLESPKGIVVDQDPKSKTVSIKVEVNVAYGVSIPQKAEEVQLKVAEAVSHFTGLQVSRVHVVFRNLIPQKPQVLTST